MGERKWREQSLPQGGSVRIKGPMGDMPSTARTMTNAVMGWSLSYRLYTMESPRQVTQRQPLSLLPHTRMLTGRQCSNYVGDKSLGVVRSPRSSFPLCPGWPPSLVRSRPSLSLSFSICTIRGLIYTNQLQSSRSLKFNKSAY